MKVCCIIFPIVFCLIAVEGQKFHQRNTNTDLNENFDIRHVKNKPERSRRNQKHSFYNDNQNYVNEFQDNGVEDFLNDILFSVREIETHVKQGGINRYYPNYYDDRPSYSYKCEDTLKDLLSLYKELASQLKYSHPAPPQIIYVPYPAPAAFNYPVDETPSKINITIKNSPKDTKPVMDIPKNIGNEDDDGSRLLSFKPKQPSSRLKIPPPPFNHGSRQAGVIVTSTSKPIYKSFIKRFGSIPQKPRYFK